MIKSSVHYVSSPMVASYEIQKDNLKENNLQPRKSDLANQPEPSITNLVNDKLKKDE